jgi:hypothetical protein
MDIKRKLEIIIEKQRDVEMVEVMKKRLDNPHAEYVDSDDFFESVGLEKEK